MEIEESVIRRSLKDEADNTIRDLHTEFFSWYESRTQ